MLPVSSKLVLMGASTGAQYLQHPAADICKVRVVDRGTREAICAGGLLGTFTRRGLLWLAAGVWNSRYTHIQEVKALR